MGNPLDILLIDDEAVVGDRLKPALEKQGDHVESYVDPKQAKARIEEKDFDIIITDIRMAEVDGIQILEWAQAKSRRTKVIMITGYATMELAREALNKGAFDFIAKPFKMKEVRAAVGKAAQALREAEDGAGGRLS